MYRMSEHMYIHILYTLFPIDVLSNDTVAEGTVRLVGGDTLLEGRVEVFLLGQWGTMCDTSWDLADATVVCHQLDYLRAVDAPRYAAFGAGSGPSWYYSLDCTGTEQNLTECSKNSLNFGRACSHSRDAGAVCSSQSYSFPCINCLHMFVCAFYCVVMVCPMHLIHVQHDIQYINSVMQLHCYYQDHPLYAYSTLLLGTMGVYACMYIY